MLFSAKSASDATFHVAVAVAVAVAVGVATPKQLMSRCSEPLLEKRFHIER
jgi:hypothetical protein